MANTQKKELSKNMILAKKLGGIFVTIACIVIIIFSLVTAIFVITGTDEDTPVPHFFGTAFMAVRSDSMTDTFDTDDLILVEMYEGDGADIKIGQVITFKTIVNNYQIVNTHRVYEISGQPGGFIYKTKGDKDGLGVDIKSVPLKDVIGVWGSVKTEGTYVDGEWNGEYIDGKNWEGMGALQNWTSDPEKGRTRFFLAIVLPLILLFVGYAAFLIRTLVIAKLDKAKAEAVNVGVDSLSEEEKLRLFEEMMKAKSDADSDVNVMSDAEVVVEEVSPENQDTIENDK